MKVFILFKYAQFFIRNRLPGNRFFKDLVAVDSVVSLTSYPARIGSVYLTLESLFSQSVRPRKIILWLSKDEFPDEVVPKTVERLIKRGLVVKFVGGNLRSYKKLMYCGDINKDFPIVTADDDCFYPKKWLKGIVDRASQHSDSIVCYRAHPLRAMAGNRMVPYRQLANLEVGDHSEPELALLPTGCGGVLYPKGSIIGIDKYKDVFLELAPDADDISFRAFSLASNYTVIRVLERNVLFLSWPSSQEHALYKNNIDAGNDEVILSVMNYFGVLEKIPMVNWNRQTDL